MNTLAMERNSLTRKRIRKGDAAMDDVTTVDEFVDCMKYINSYNEDDPETSHYNADQLMMETLEELGYGEGIKIFREMWKWYA